MTAVGEDYRKEFQTPMRVVGVVSRVLVQFEVQVQDGGG
jgi:hypothetical protein